LKFSFIGELSKEDLIEMARRKMKSPRRKLELHAYKQKLLKLSKETQEEHEQSNYPEWLASGLEILGISTKKFQDNGDAEDEIES
jgi:hypothetical protein